MKKSQKYSTNVSNEGCEEKVTPSPSQTDKKIAVSPLQNSSSYNISNSKIASQSTNNCVNKNLNEFNENPINVNSNSSGNPNLNANSSQIVNNITENLSSQSPTSFIKKKSSSFLHRDYNRKPILARSQVSK